MILLNAAARAKFAYLSTPPTHAAVASRLIMYQSGSFAVVNGFTLNYWFGNLDGGGNFVINVNAPTHVLTIPDPQFSGVIPAATITAVLTNIFGAGIAPSPTDPTVSIVVPNKKAGDHKLIDIDAVAAFLDPALAGTVI